MKSELVWEPKQWKPEVPNACALLDMQYAMRLMGIPVAPLWSEHMGEPTLTALSIEMPAQWAENHYRLCRAWQDSGATDDDSPRAIAIARLMQKCDQKRLRARPYVAPGVLTALAQREGRSVQELFAERRRLREERERMFQA